MLDRKPAHSRLVIDAVCSHATLRRCSTPLCTRAARFRSAGFTMAEPC